MRSRPRRRSCIVDADKPQFEDINVRKAFFLGVDIDQQKQIAWNGLDYEEEPAGSLNMYGFQDGYKDSFAEAGLKYDVDEAKKLLDDAGWTEGDDGIREKDGVKLSVVYPVFSDDPTHEALAKSLQAAGEGDRHRPADRGPRLRTSRPTSPRRTGTCSRCASPTPTRSARRTSASSTARTAA